MKRQPCWCGAVLHCLCITLLFHCVSVCCVRLHVNIYKYRHNTTAAADSLMKIYNVYILHKQYKVTMCLSGPYRFVWTRNQILDLKIMTVLVFSRGVKIANGFYVVSWPTGLTVDSLQWWNDELLRRPWANRTTSCLTLFVDCNLFVQSDLSKGHPSFRMWSCVGFFPLL